MSPLVTFPPTYLELSQHLIIMTREMALMCYDQAASPLCPVVSAIGIIPKPASLGGSQELHSTQHVQVIVLLLF